jgi:hypothetical protein
VIRLFAGIAEADPLERGDIGRAAIGVGELTFLDDTAAGGVSISCMAEKSPATHSLPKRSTSRSSSDSAKSALPMTTTGSSAPVASDAISSRRAKCRRAH